MNDLPSKAAIDAQLENAGAVPLTDYPFQRTLKESISCSGIGLHQGHKVSMTMHPAAPDTGIVFRRTDPAGRNSEIPALWNAVVDTRLCTTIGNQDGVTISTTEHLVAALAGMGVDNVLVEVDAPELPVMDGSSESFVFLIECAGLVDLDAPRRVLEIFRPVTIGDARKSAALLPATGQSLSFEIDFPNPVIGRQRYAIDLVDGAFKAEIARARTFGFEKEVAMLRSMGLAKGGSLENAVVLSDDSVLNEEGLRFSDEFVRHKLLDSVGDLFLAGGYIRGQFHGYKSGHELNNKLLRAVFSDEDAYRWTTSTGEELEPPVASGPAAAMRAVAAMA